MAFSPLSSSSIWTFFSRNRFFRRLPYIRFILKKKQTKCVSVLTSNTIQITRICFCFELFPFYSTYSIFILYSVGSVVIWSRIWDIAFEGFKMYNYVWLHMYICVSLPYIILLPSILLFTLKTEQCILGNMECDKCDIAIVRCDITCDVSFAIFSKISTKGWRTQRHACSPNASERIPNN